MKKYLLYSAFAVATLTGCSESFLTIDPAGSVSQGTLANYNGVEMAAAGAYAQLYGGGPQAPLSNHIWGDCLGGDANKGSEPSDQADWGSLDSYQFVNNNSYIRSKWNRCYEGVHRANELMVLVEKAGSNLDGKELDGVDYATEITAEARFLKGLWAFEQIRVFGAYVPYVSLDDYKKATDPQVSNYDENGLIAIWDKAAEDLKYAYENLPETRSKNTKGRANKWAAASYLAKLYLYWSSPYNGTNATDASKVNDAKSLFKKIIEEGKTSEGTKYALVDNYSSLWDNSRFDSDWNSEVIFDVQQFVSGTTSAPNSINAAYYPAYAGAIKGSGWGFYVPSSDLAHSYMVDANGLPLADYREKTLKQEDKMSNLDPNDDKVIVTDFSIVVDPRLDVTMGRFGVPFYQWGTPTEHGKWVRHLLNCGYFLNKKMTETSENDGVSTTSGTTAKNFHLIRLADVYLMYAEACIRTNDLVEAKKYINLVRERAAKSCLINKGSGRVMKDLVNGKTIEDAAGNYAVGIYKNDFASADEAWTALKRERRAELGMEGQRWFDLCRWGNIEQDLGEYLAYEKVAFAGVPTKFGSKYESKWICMPVPFTEMNILGDKIKQNPNWE